MSDSKRFSVGRISHLARIELSDEQQLVAAQELDKVLEFVGCLNELDLSQVEPFFGLETGHAVGDQGPIRDDHVRPSTPREEILSNAPDADGEFYQVPAVFD